MFGQVDHQTQILYGILIDRAHRVVDEAARSQDGEGEYSGVVGLVFVEGADSLRVDHNYVQFLALRSLTLDRSAPAPQPLGARVDGRTHSEPIAPVEQHLIKQVGLASPVEPSNGDNPDGPGHIANELAGLLSEDVLYIDDGDYFRRWGPRR